MKSIQSPANPNDAELEERIRIFLDQRNVPSLRRLNVSAENGTVHLRGKVRSFYEKQLCLSCCKRVAGVMRVVDDIKVDKRGAALGLRS
jgi:osmotically-inducible protein OsmY